MLETMQEKYLEKQRNFLFTFLLLEMVCDRVPTGVVYWCLPKRGIQECLTRLVKVTYEDTPSEVKTVHGQSEPVMIDVGLRQGSALSLFAFVVVLDTISNEIGRRVPWELLFADALE